MLHTDTIGPVAQQTGRSPSAAPAVLLTSSLLHGRGWLAAPQLELPSFLERLAAAGPSVLLGTREGFMPELSRILTHELEAPQLDAEISRVSVDAQRPRWRRRRPQAAPEASRPGKSMTFGRS